MLKRSILLIFIAVMMLRAESITVAVSANAQYAAKEICDNFQKWSGIGVKTVVSSSGKLTAQIERGAPFDLFLSADMRYPEYLKREGYAVSEPKVYAFGGLILWSLKGLDLKNGVLSLKGAKIEHLAIPNPKSAPYGKEALKVLKGAGIYEDIKPKLVYAESVSQTNRYIASKAVDAGITAKSVIFSPKMGGVGKYVEVDDSLYDPIRQGVVILKHAKEGRESEAKAFYDYLFSQEGREILKKYGYRVP